MQEVKRNTLYSQFSTIVGSGGFLPFPSTDPEQGKGWVNVGYSFDNFLYFRFKRRYIHSFLPSNVCSATDILPQTLQIQSSIYFLSMEHSSRCPTRDPCNSSFSDSWILLSILIMELSSPLTCKSFVEAGCPPFYFAIWVLKMSFPSPSAIWSKSQLG